MCELAASCRPRPFFNAEAQSDSWLQWSQLTLARKIAAITLILWKKGAHFDAEQLKPQAV
jgi:hypothetical protein